MNIRNILVIGFFAILVSLGAFARITDTGKVTVNDITADHGTLSGPETPPIEPEVRLASFSQKSKQDDEPSLEDQAGMMRLILRSKLSDIEGIIKRSPGVSSKLPGNRGKLSMRWGRAVLPTYDAFRIGYAEYEFFSNSTYTVWGYNLTQYFKTVGIYSTKDSKLYLYDLGVLEGKDQFLGYRVATIDGFNIFNYGDWQFVKDRVWNKSSKKPGYVDRLGRPRNDRIVGGGSGLETNVQPKLSALEKECARTLRDARVLYASFTDEQMKGDLSVQIPNRLLGCPVSNESYVFNSKTRIVKCRTCGK